MEFRRDSRKAGQKTSAIVERISPRFVIVVFPVVVGLRQDNQGVADIAVLIERPYKRTKRSTVIFNEMKETYAGYQNPSKPAASPFIVA
jgi:hypothetical protein